MEYSSDMQDVLLNTDKLQTFYSSIDEVSKDYSQNEEPIGNDVETVYFTLTNGEEIEFTVDHGPVPIEDIFLPNL